jgi:hypothetical protein
MSWTSQQDELNQEARLFLANPEVVFEELKKLRGKSKTELRKNDRLETVLVMRNHPLINLGLACYGANKDVFAALYKHSLEQPADEKDAQYKEGLRIGCLSNATLAKAHFLRDFPKEIVGPQETWRVLFDGTDAETKALICNPSLEEDLLVALYRRADMFAQMPEERWQELIRLSAENERLVTEKESWDPDFRDIQSAIFTLLEIAPVNIQWLWRLYYFLDALAPGHVATPQKIDHVLARWATLDDQHSDGKVIEGRYTPLSIKDEFRCLVAALFGRGWVNGHFVVHGSPGAKDVALRCAYYGKGEITAKGMRDGYKRDKEVFAFAVLFNDRIYDRPELRKPLQGEFWGGMFERYSKYKSQRQQLRRQRHESRRGAEYDLTDESWDAEAAELASQQTGIQKAFGFVGYAWLIITNLLYLAIIAFVLDRTHELDPKLTIVIATIGLVYVTVRGMAMSHLAYAPVLLGMAKYLDELKGRGGKRLATSEEYALAEAQLKRAPIKFYIQSLFLSLTSLICLYAVYTSLP